MSDFAVRVSAFEVSDADADTYEKDYLMGGEGLEDAYPGVARDWRLKGGSKRKGGVVVLVFASILALTLASILVHSCYQEYNNEQRTILASAGFFVAGWMMFVSFINLCASWRGTRKSDASSSVNLAHALSFVSIVFLLVFACAVLFFWSEKKTEGKSSGVGIGRYWMIGLTFGMMFTLILSMYGTLKLGGLYRWTLFANCIFMMAGGFTMTFMGATVIRTQPELNQWPDAWSVYGIVVSGAVLFLVSLIGLQITNPASLHWMLVLLPLVGVLTAACSVADLLLSHPDLTAGTTSNDVLFVVSLLGISEEVFLLQALVTSWVWHSQRVDSKASEFQVIDDELADPSSVY